MPTKVYQKSFNEIIYAAKCIFVRENMIFLMMIRDFSWEGFYPFFMNLSLPLSLSLPFSSHRVTQASSFSVLSAPGICSAQASTTQWPFVYYQIKGEKIIYQCICLLLAVTIIIAIKYRKKHTMPPDDARFISIFSHSFCLSALAGVHLDRGIKIVRLVLLLLLFTH